MSETSPVLLLVGIIALVLIAVGLFAFVITYLGRGPSKKKSPAVLGSAKAPVETPSPPTPSQQTSSEPPATKESLPSHPGEVMRVIRDQQTGRLLVQVEGQQYAHIREIKDAQVGRRVLWAIADLLRFTGGMVANPQALQSIRQAESAPTSSFKPQPEAQPVRQPTPQSQTQPAAATALPVAPLQRPSPPRLVPREAATSPDTARQQKTVGETVAGFFRRGLQPPPSAQKPVSFVEQIEEVLQRYIQGLPTPLSCEVHVQAAQDGSLQIQVGSDIYSSPSDIPDPQIRQLIQAAVAEWEKR